MTLHLEYAPMKNTSRDRRGLAVRFCCGLIGAMLLYAPSASAADYRLEPLQESAPKDEVSAKIYQRLQATGFRVIRGKSRTYCKLWLCKEVAVREGNSEGYPLVEGSLVGVVQFARRGGDFRDQEIPPGVYTLRYATIPTDGAHEGVSPTPSFLLLVSASEDQDPAPQDVESLVEKSAASIDSSHPAIWALKPPKDGETPGLWHDEEHDWWLAHLTVPTNGKPKELKFAVVVVGYTEE